MSDPPRRPPPRTRGAYVVALVLAVAIGTATNMFTLAMLLDAALGVSSPREAGLSENATQVLTGWGGGIIGVIGAVVGYSAGQAAGRSERSPAPE